MSGGDYDCLYEFRKFEIWFINIIIIFNFI